MQIKTYHDPVAGVVTISISGRFDIELSSEFMAISRHLTRDAKDYVINLMDTDYMDAAALGCLVVLWHEKPVYSKMSVVNCTKEIMQTLSIGGFDKLFSISGETVFGNTLPHARVA